MVNHLDKLNESDFSSIVSDNKPDDETESVALISMLAAIEAGLVASRRLLQVGYSIDGDAPRYPGGEIFMPTKENEKLCSCEIPIIANALQPDRGYWRILGSLLGENQTFLYRALELLALNKAKPTPEDKEFLPVDEVERESCDLQYQDAEARRLLSCVPKAQYGALKTYDRHEIENYRSLHSLLHDYLATRSHSRPLSIAVFGPPGSGKSFGVKEVSKSLKGHAGCRDIETLTFNLSLYNKPDELTGAFHLVRDVSLRGKVPLVFFDEFDTALDGKRLGWLRYFLSPMQDGEFLDRGAPHPIGPAIFIFAGGTCDCYSHFLRNGTKEESNFDFKAVKGPDFLSRLRAKLDIPSSNLAVAYRPIKSNSDQTDSSKSDKAGKTSGAEQGEPANASKHGDVTLPVGTVTFDPYGPVEVLPSEAAVRLRRAGVLSFILGKKAPGLVQTDKSLAVNPAVLRGLLGLPSFLYGNRSLEALLDMSHLLNAEDFTPALLPASCQTPLHANEYHLSQLISTEYPFPNDDLVKIAQAIHGDYLNQRKAKKELNPNKPSHQKWDKLIEKYKRSNKEQANSIPSKLRLMGLWFRKTPSGKTPPPESDQLNKNQIELLAHLEHDRWVSAQRNAGYIYREGDEDTNERTHCCILPWDSPDLPKHEKDKDRDAIRAIPRYLKAAGYEIIEIQQ